MSTIHDKATVEALKSRLSKLEPETPRLWGSMSAQGMVCHLTDTFLVCLGDRPYDRSPSLLERTVIRFMALTLPFPWPKGVPTLPELDQTKQGTPPGVFRADVERLLSVMDDFIARLDAKTMIHPAFGRLSRAEWGRWAFRHVDHHSRQFGL